MKNQILSEEFSRMQKLAGIQLVENRQSEAKKLFSEWSQDINTFEEFASFLKEEGFDEEQRINFIIEILNSLILIPNQISEKFDLQQKIKNFNEIKVTNPNAFKISLQDYIEKFMPDITYEDVEEYGVKNFNDFFEFLKDYGYEPLDILIELGDNYLNPKPLERISVKKDQEDNNNNKPKKVYSEMPTPEEVYQDMIIAKPSLKNKPYKFLGDQKIINQDWGSKVNYYFEVEDNYGGKHILYMHYWNRGNKWKTDTEGPRYSSIH